MIDMSATSGSISLLGRLETLSDRISPIVVKEVRQFVRSRDFISSFAVSLIVATLIAFFGSTSALAGSRVAGRSAFSTLTVCLALLGMAVVPIGAFTALRTERLEQTLDLICLTRLSPRRIVLGKLAAQAVKLSTLFAVLAPFVATSFLLGGVDIVTIAIALAGLFIASMWAATAALFLSTMFKSKVMSGLMFGLFGFGLFVVYVAGRALLFAGFGVPIAGPPRSGLLYLGELALFCGTTMLNLVLLAESRLAAPAENKSATLRLGFLLQLVVLLTWGLTSMFHTTYGRTQTFEIVMGLGSLHLGVVTLFDLTEALGMREVVAVQALPPMLRRWPWLRSVLGPGTSRAVRFALLQFALFIGAATALTRDSGSVRMAAATCGAVAVLSGIPTLLARRARGAGLGPLHARGIALILLALMFVLPDLTYYLLWSPDQFSGNFAARHLFNPVLTLFNWSTVVKNRWELAPLAWTAVGIASYILLLTRVGGSSDKHPAVMTLTRSASERADDGRPH